MVTRNLYNPSKIFEEYYKCRVDPGAGTRDCDSQLVLSFEEFEKCRVTVTRFGGVFASGAVFIRKNAISLQISGPLIQCQLNYVFLCQMHFWASKWSPFRAPFSMPESAFDTGKHS